MEKKRCIDCERELPLDKFYRRKPEKPTHTTVLTGQCKECRIKKSRQWWSENIDRHRTLVKRRYETHRRYARYGLSVETFDAMLAKQGGVCAICRAEKPGGKGKWHVDHVGGTTRGVFNQCQADGVRGLLCHRCNVSLGHYEKLLRRVGEESVLSYLKGSSTGDLNGT